MPPSIRDVILPAPQISVLTGIAGMDKLVQFSLNLSLTGGSFTTQVLKDSLGVPGENFVIGLPHGRVGVVKNTGRQLNRGGLVDTIGGPAVPLAAVTYTFVAIVPGSHQAPALLAARFGLPTFWRTRNDPIKNYSYRGPALAGIQQLAQNFLADVIVYSNGIYVVDPGVAVGLNFNVDTGDIISMEQDVDYTQSQIAVLNPMLLAVQGPLDTDFVYDSDHAQKQGNVFLTIGAQKGTGANDFVEIPAGWLVEGDFEEWIPPAGTDFTNPSSTANNGRYWKVFQSPTQPGMLRGILSFTRLVRDLRLNPPPPPLSPTPNPGNISTFVGSPVTILTDPSPGPFSFVFENQQSENGIFGFTADQDTVLDIVTNQQVTVNNSFSILPNSGGPDSGAASQHYYTIQYGLWTFPRVVPTIIPTGGKDPTNPFNLPSNVIVVNPSTQVLPVPASGTSALSALQAYYGAYVKNYKTIHSPALVTTVQFMFRGTIPQPGDILILPAANVQNCGRIETVTLNLSRGGCTVSVTARLLSVAAPAIQD